MEIPSGAIHTHRALRLGLCADRLLLAFIGGVPVGDPISGAMYHPSTPAPTADLELDGNSRRNEIQDQRRRRLRPVRSSQLLKGFPHVSAARIVAEQLEDRLASFT